MNNNKNIKVISSIFGAAFVVIFALAANYYIVAWQEPTMSPPGGGPTPTAFPVGMVNAFNLAACPTGWTLADGFDGRPDLRGKFVLGAGAGYSLGAIGGEVNHTLTTSEIPSHYHLFGGAGSITTGGYGNSYYDFDGLQSNVYTGSTGGDNSHNNMPPYHTLIYCVKM